MNERIGVVVLAAGKGSRMKSDLPKVMHELKGKPMVDHVVSNIESSGCCEQPVVIVTPDHTMVEDALGSRARYAPQDKQLGTGHAVRCAEETLRGTVDHVIALYGDMPYLSGASIAKLVDLHVSSGTVMSMLTATTPDFEDWRASFTRFGRIVRNDDGSFERIVEYKDATEEEREIRELSTCYFCFQSEWLWDHLAMLKNNNAQEEYYLVDLVKMAKDEGEDIASMEIDLREVIGVNTQDDLKRAESL
jgi:bifunctional UDP-N-acetylglucosamine pyrophosphorylase/glucosamine-1-phosphate N-acetyltransferase